ncbi:putative bifunctional diguanylate cyclase/phosphodiesterase [Erythrobacter sp. BLCC-B19]|uniref:putative bifunctional diguanylate cyclase/phosphodiesterase n=1 Tax=Erythrobacter sp. BLCC-B19 TaxID=3025315 RepID=UPI002361BADD|nr:bifunctional diguanylate cyclase/phosphodiesterase [Erythrobacter sp. BLCC-B19]WDA41696.1 bifunctional diguanylate cyclase/phosphodiesterase [Erythrobacter sp. BLCC-B19]
MSTAKQPLRLTSTGLVLIPIAVASVMSAALVMVVSFSDDLAIASPGALLISAILVYAAVLFFLGRSGIASIRGLEARAITDPLTGLSNRHALHEDILFAARGEEEVALAMIDLDSFKQVNDHYGHAVGDQLIEECAKLIRAVCGKEAQCYRLGGDEFAMVMSGKVAGTILEGICRTLIEKLGTPIALGHRQIAVGASIGLTRSTADLRVPSSEMLRRADVAMDMSKRGGKMRCTWFNESFDRRRERVREIEDEIRTAIAGGEFNVAYQPLVSAEDKRIVAVEALLRWDRGTRDPLGPNIFIPVAEESGLINPLGLWVLRQAVCDARRWGDITLSVNISAAQLRNAEFPIKLGEVLEETGFPPHRLELEVTETCLVLDPVVAERTLDVIRSFGVRIALDDFGTGYASIGFLRRFRFEKLKLDRSLVELAGVDDGSRAMMLSSIALARALNMGVTAEGVETEEQAELVRLAGCDQIQGWLYYKALPAAEIDRLIAEQSLSSAQVAGPAHGDEQAA